MQRLVGQTPAQRRTDCRVQQCRSRKAGCRIDDGTVAANIAGRTAAEIYGLDMVAECIEDEPNNTMRFLVMGHHEIGASGSDKTSLAVSAPNRAGAVASSCCNQLIESGICMTKFESRPSNSVLWEYLFFIDIGMTPPGRADSDGIGTLVGNALRSSVSSFCTRPPFCSGGSVQTAFQA